MDSDEQSSDAGLRRTAFAVAYRMLGSVSDAEDVVQEALLRVHQTRSRGEHLESPPAFVTTVTARLALDVLRSARVRRETYTGEWLPEPLVSDPEQNPAARAELSDSLSMAFLVLLETLTPEQRAALLLRDVFDYGYHEVAAVIGTTPANARQLASRARHRVQDRRPRFTADPARRRELAEAFFAAALDGDVRALMSLLAEDVVLRGDGGGKVPALARAVTGPAHVARTLLAWTRAGRARGAALHGAQVNGEPGLVTHDAAGRVVGVLVLDIVDDVVVGLCSVVNPDKLAHLGAVGDLWGTSKVTAATGSRTAAYAPE